MQSATSNTSSFALLGSLCNLISSVYEKGLRSERFRGPRPCAFRSEITWREIACCFGLSIATGTGSSPLFLTPNLSKDPSFTFPRSGAFPVDAGEITPPDADADAAQTILAEGPSLDLFSSAQNRRLGNSGQNKTKKPENPKPRKST